MKMIIAKNSIWTYKIVFESGDVRELRRKLEEKAYDYLQSLQVQPEKYHKKSKSGHWGKHPFGYFMVYKPGKITIYNKVLNHGYIYNSVTITKVISFSIIEPAKKIHTFLERCEEAIQGFIMYKMNEWQEIHDCIEVKDKPEQVDLIKD